MSTLPTPLLSLLRRFFLDISNWRPYGAHTRARFTGLFTSLLRAAAIPSLGYLFEWRTRLRTDSASLKVSNEKPGDDESRDSDDDGGGTSEKRTVNQSSRQSKSPRANRPDTEKDKVLYDPNAPIYRMMNNPALFESIRAPRNPIVLAHGLYGYDVLGFSALPRVQMHYWNDVLRILRNKVGAKVIVTRAPSTGTIKERADMIHEILKREVRGRDLNFIAHSMGGLDCRYLISNIKPAEYTPRTLTTICTPHRGSPFMDWLTEGIGLGSIKDPLPGVPPVTPIISLPAPLLSFLDSPAYSNLTSNYLNALFNPSAPDSPDVKYWSVAARSSGIPFWHPLWIPRLVLDGLEQTMLKGSIPRRDIGNDGIVPVQSAKWGEFLGVLENCNHWDIKGDSGIAGQADFEGKLKADADAQIESKWDWSDWQRFFGTWNQGKDREKMKLKVPESQRDDVDMSKLGTPFKESASKEQILEGKGTVGQSSETPFVDSVLDWVVENVPGVNAAKAPLKMVGVLGEEKDVPIKKEEKSVDKGMAPRFDLERFYTALCRKLYDEGY
ncbi:hypothetical protein FRC17_001583 [Serendipita sp. 399]|nr:hypothetical protein FRC17_001583 [Serendipita sp. 399]